MESSGSGKNRTVTVVHEEIWSLKGIIEQPRNFPLHEAVELRYELPADALPTRLSADKPLFWELEVKLDLQALISTKLISCQFTERNSAASISCPARADQISFSSIVFPLSCCARHSRFVNGLRTHKKFQHHCPH